MRVSPNVANLPLRPPAVLARSVATLDLLSGGRVELGLGAGAFWDAIAAHRRPPADPGARACRALEEAIAVIRAMWDAGRRERAGRRAAPPRWRCPPRAGPGARRRHLARGVQAADARADRPARRRLAAQQPYAGTRRAAGAMNAGDRRGGGGGRAASRSAIRRLYNITGRFAERRPAGSSHGPPAVVGRAARRADPDPRHERLHPVAPTTPTTSAGSPPRWPRPSGDRAASAVRRPERAVRPLPVSTPADVRDAAGCSGCDRPVPGSPSTAHAGRRHPAERRCGSGTSRRARPAPRPTPDRTYTAHEQAAGRHLIDVHDHLRAELQQAARPDRAGARRHVDPGRRAVAHQRR